MAEADCQFQHLGGGKTVVFCRRLQLAPEGLAGEGPGKVQALLPASAGADVAVQHPAEHCDHLQGRLGDKEPAMAGGDGGGQAAAVCVAARRPW